jgi:hypothetical protein
MGSDADLDSAIEYYLEDDNDVEEDYEDSEEDDY